MKKFRLNRRHFLKGTKALIALPVLECMLGPHGKSFAFSGAPLPRRFGVFFFGNGVPLDKWVPSASGATWELSECLAPLVSVKDYCHVVSGYDVLTSGAQLHHGGQAGILSGLPYLEVVGIDEAFASQFSGPSIDQMVVQALNPTTTHASLELGVSKSIWSNGGPTLQAISHEGLYAPRPPLLDPAEVYALLFDNYAPPEHPRRELKNNILDAVLGDIHALKQKMGTADRQRLDEHLTAISELRQRILDLPTEYIDACIPIETVTEQNHNNGVNEPLEAVNQIMCDLWVLAWACDLTRVTSMMYTAAMAETIFHPVAGVTQGHHSMIHDGDETQQALLPAITTFTISQFAYLLEKLASAPEGDGCILDNSLILLTSDCAEISGDSNEDYPVLLAGGCGGSIKGPGIHHRQVGANTNDILVSILLAMQTGRDTVGEGSTSSNMPIVDLFS